MEGPPQHDAKDQKPDPDDHVVYDPIIGNVQKSQKAN